MLFVEPAGTGVFFEGPKIYRAVTDLFQSLRQHGMSQPGSPAFRQGVNGNDLRPILRFLPADKTLLTAHEEVHSALPVNAFQHSAAVIRVGAGIHGFWGHKVRKCTAEGCDHDFGGKGHIFQDCVSDRHHCTSFVRLLVNQPIQ